MELRRAGARGSLLSASSSIDRSLAISCSNLVNGLFLLRYGRYSYFQGISALGGQGKTEEVSRPAWLIVRVAKNTTQMCVANGSPRFIF
jgi:hypothetical protein